MYCGIISSSLMSWYWFCLCVASLPVNLPLRFQFCIDLLSWHCCAKSESMVYNVQYTYDWLYGRKEREEPNTDAVFNLKLQSAKQAEHQNSFCWDSWKSLSRYNFNCVSEPVNLKFVNDEFATYMDCCGVSRVNYVVLDVMSAFRTVERKQCYTSGLPCKYFYRTYNIIYKSKQLTCFNYLWS